VVSEKKIQLLFLPKILVYKYFIVVIILYTQKDIKKKKKPENIFFHSIKGYQGENECVK